MARESPPWARSAGRRVRSLKDAEAFVTALGFCTWGPIPGLAFPNLAEAMGETAWSVLGRTWFWKDDVHIQRRLYYAKIIGGQPTFVAPGYLPDLVAALGGRGRAVERDPLELYAQGRLSRSALQLYDCLVTNGRSATAALRRLARVSAVERGLVELQRRFLVCKVDLTGRTRGTYSYVWDLAERFWPQAFDEARGTAPAAARARVRSRLRKFGIEPTPALEERLFLWRPEA